MSSALKGTHCGSRELPLILGRGAVADVAHCDCSMIRFSDFA
jgi:hypothetical protein